MVAFASAWLAACGGASATSRTSLETGGSAPRDDRRRRRRRVAVAVAVAVSAEAHGHPARGRPRDLLVRGPRSAHGAAAADPRRRGRRGDLLRLEHLEPEPDRAASSSSCRAAAKSSPVHRPLLLMTDQEGGQVRRLPGAPVLSEKQIGERAQRDRRGRVAAGTRRRAPARVGRDEHQPRAGARRVPAAGDFDDQFQRSYSSDPAKVAALGSAFVTAQQQTGVGGDRQALPRPRRRDRLRRTPTSVRSR